MTAAWNLGGTAACEELTWVWLGLAGSCLPLNCTLLMLSFKAKPPESDKMRLRQTLTRDCGENENKNQLNIQFYI